MYLLDLLDTKMICAVTWWNICACYSVNLFASPSSITWGKHSADGEASIAPIYSGNYLSTLSRYFIIYTLNLPYPQYSKSITRKSCTFPLCNINFLPHMPDRYVSNLEISNLSWWETLRSSTWNVTVTFLPLIMLFTTHGS